MTTPTVPGVDRDALADAIQRDTVAGFWLAGSVADAALAHIAEHHKCACDREHADEWVEVDDGRDLGLPMGARIRLEWTKGRSRAVRRFVHRDDLPEPDADPVERMARAIFASEVPDIKWDAHTESFRASYRKAARAALAAYRKWDEEQ